jgi:hypothetical protein
MKKRIAKKIVNSHYRPYSKCQILNAYRCLYRNEIKENINFSMKSLATAIGIPVKYINSGPFNISAAINAQMKLHPDIHELSMETIISSD